MKFTINKLIYVLPLLVAISCIDPVTLKNDPAINILVIEGGITSELGPHTIRLTASARYGDIFAGEIKGVEGADVFIRDNIGNLVKLQESDKGFYTTPNNFKGEIGRSYTLLIETIEGKQYSSYPEPLLPVSKIDSLFYEFKEIPSTDEEGLPTFISGVDVKVKFKDPGSVDNYYKWEADGFYRRKTNPELFTIVDQRTGLRIPAPKDCCALCWITDDNKAVEVMTDFIHDGSDVVHTSVFIEDDGARFSDKYLIIINQYSISKEGYQFYDLLKQQLEIDGDIFDPPPAEISGNIINLTDASIPVIGYFRVSDVSRDSLFIYGIDLPYLSRPVPFLDDCRLLLNSTDIKPSYW